LTKQESQLLLRVRVSVANYTGDEANKLSTIGQCKMHHFETFKST